MGREWKGGKGGEDRGGEGREGRGRDGKGGHPQYFIGPPSSSFLEICLCGSLCGRRPPLLSKAPRNSL